MSNFDPNFPNRLDPVPEPDPMLRTEKNQGWILGLGVIAVILIVGLLAFGRNDQTNLANDRYNAPQVNTAANPTTTPNPATPPMSPRPSAPTTTGSAPSNQ